MRTRRQTLKIAFGAAALVAASSLIGCGGAGEEVIIKTAAGAELKAADIDRDPYALLPEGPLLLVKTDAQAQFRSQFGQKLLQIVMSRLPVPQSAQFVPERDLDSLLVGVYSMQGVDFAAVATGRFSPQSIAAAADGVTQTPLGAPLVKSEYAGRTLYTVGNVGFTLLTDHTVLYGNETGMRRALDRIAQGQLQRRIPQWMESFLRTQNAPLVAAADLASSPEVAAAASSVALAHGLSAATVTGNFEAPGMNLGGRLTYQDANTAQQGAQAIIALRQRIQSYSFLTALMGIGDPIQQLTVTPANNVVDFQLALQGGVVTQLLNQLGGAVGVPAGPVRATTTPSH
ncbi:MAG TPA: hypothetical protein VL137_14460 [Polyangiaceae bacterium]|nr:hypothetical protein [Polyangiaceae bacterium]